MIGRTSRNGRINLREETDPKDLKKMSLQRKVTLIKTRRKLLIRRKFSVSNVKNLDILHLNVGLVRESKSRMTRNKLRLHKMVQTLSHYT